MTFSDYAICKNCGCFLRDHKSATNEIGLENLCPPVDSDMNKALRWTGRYFKNPASYWSQGKGTVFAPIVIY